MERTEIDIADVPVGERWADIRRMLVRRQRDLLDEIQSRVRDVRETGSGSHHNIPDPYEAVEAEPSNDLAFALIQMKAETLERVSDAVRRVDDGTYGCCLDCGEAIASSRLRAIPFAVRCRDCEETSEGERHRERGGLQRVPSWRRLAVLAR